MALPDESTPRTGTLETEETETSLRFTFLPDPDSLRRSHIKEPVEQILLAEVDRQAARVRIYPIVPFWDNDRYLKPKYAQVQCFELPIDDVDLDYIADFTALTERFPRGFVQDYQFGLGLGKPYRPIVSVVEEHTECTEIHLCDVAGEPYIDGQKFVLSLQRFEELRIELYRINSRAQSAAMRVKSAVARNTLSSAMGVERVEPGRGRHPLSKVITDSITGTTPLSENQQDELISAAVAESVALERRRPGSVSKLRNDLDLVTLDALIERFEQTMHKRTPESSWQRFFQDNPFALHLAFGYPLIQIHGQASVGGTQFSGGGEKVADFLVRNAVTNNVGIFEIKTPASQLIKSRTYRGGVHTPAIELTAAVTQALDQKYQLENSFVQRKHASRMPDLESYIVRCCVVIGTTPQDINAQKSFELFRGNSRLVDIVTYDELLMKLRQLRQLLGGSGKNQI